MDLDSHGSKIIANHIIGIQNMIKLFFITSLSTFLLASTALSVDLSTCAYECCATDFSASNFRIAVDESGTPLGCDCSCIPGHQVSYYLSVDLTNEASAGVYNIWILYDKYENGVDVGRFKSCLVIVLAGQSSTTATVPFSWTYGASLELRNVIITWSTSPFDANSNEPSQCHPPAQSWCISEVAIETPVSCTITAPDAVCANSNGNTASVPGQPGASYSWSVSGGTIASGQGTNSITWSSGSSSPAVITVTVSRGTCSKTCTKSVIVNPKPDCTITAPNAVCADSAGNTASVADAGHGASYEWSIQGGTITSSQPYGPSITWTAGGSGLATLSVTVSNGNGCSASSIKDVTINPHPDCTITAPDEVCPGSSGNVASVGDAGQGASYEWSIQGGTITGGLGTNSIIWTAGGIGLATLSITVSNGNGCSASCTKDVKIDPHPVCTLTVPNIVCAGSTGNTASVADAGIGASYEWSIQGGTITSSQPYGPSITWTAGDAGIATIGVTVMSASGCPATCSKEIAVENCDSKITKVTPGSTEVCAGTAVQIKAHATGERNIRSVTLYYKKQGDAGYTSAAMQIQGINPDHKDADWAAALTGQMAGTQISYYITASDQDGNEARAPAGGQPDYLITWRNCNEPEIVVTPETSVVCVGIGKNIVADVTSTYPVKSVTLFYTDPSGPHEVEMNLDSGTPMDSRWVYFLPNYPDGTVITYYVVVVDEQGNVARAPEGEGSYQLTWIICRNGLQLTKTASSSVVGPGGAVTYTVTYANTGGIDLQNVVITESYPHGVSFISASPAPDSGTNNRWTIGTLPAHASGVITIDVRAPDDPNIKFSFEQEARGTGFVRTYKDLTTGREPYSLMNVVSATAQDIQGVRAVSYVTVSGEAGTKAAMRESGSGTYTRDEGLYYYKENRSIKDVSNLSASYHATVFDLPKNRSIGYASTWTERECAKNYITSESVNEEYRYATMVKRDSSIWLDRNGTNMAVDSQFEGTRHAGYAAVSGPDGKGHISTLKELSSDYAGSFRVKEKLGTTFSNRSNAITGVKHHDSPHATIYQEGQQDNRDNSNLNYTISILNDGNRALGPIYMRDVFPAGTFFLDASTRPSDPNEADLIDSPYANWTFTYLPVGRSVTLYLRVKIYQVIDVPVNWVYVSAGYGGSWIEISNSTATNSNWLSCTPQGVCKKTSSGWNPPDWGFDRTEDICSSCIMQGL